MEQLAAVVGEAEGPLSLEEEGVLSRRHSYLNVG